MGMNTHTIMVEGMVVASMPFSQALDCYLELRAKGPDESGGYTDKQWYRQMEALRERMDSLAPGPL